MCGEHAGAHFDALVHCWHRHTQGSVDTIEARNFLAPVQNALENPTRDVSRASCCRPRASYTSMRRSNSAGSPP
ncbi:hypothetical protein CBM2589_B120351 [Cupriavidus taiwanensis]|uniref:Uncharacterized protein n=1 Tax=Cupriavidus taiwanensis TaxID=164546 RepID=A0A975ZY46_9BURK|nr:hypothetical protein CBM2589_B120351 [Cupriavidus taiwanensis]